MGLIFDNVDLEQEFGVIIDGASSWPKPERDVSYIHVPGRSGDILMDNGCWKNVNISYNFLIKDDWKTAFEDFAAWLCSHVGYFRLEDPVRHPGVYRMASFTGPLDPDLWFTTDTGVFTVEFNCKPQQWLTSGETPIELNVGLTFPGRIIPAGESHGSGNLYYDYTVQEESPDAIKSRCTEQVAIIDSGSGTVTAVKITYTNNSASSKNVNVVIAEYDEQTSSKSCLVWNETVPAGGTITKTLEWNFSDTNDTMWFSGSIYSASGLEGDTLDVQVYGQPEGLAGVEKTVTNPTGFQSNPTIISDSTGGGRIGVNDFTVNVSAADVGNIVIDCDTENCYSIEDGEFVNANQYVSISNSDPKEMRDFPYFKQGENTINAYSSSEFTVTADTEWKVTISPNWHRI